VFVLCKESKGGNEFVFYLRDNSISYVQVAIFKRSCFLSHHELLCKYTGSCTYSQC
jgi:hypothetical protein